MALIKPFKGVRPVKDKAKDIAALPYDVYSKEEAKKAVQNAPYSFLKIDRAETFFDDNIDMYSEVVYAKARDTLYEMLDNKLFIQDDQPALYIYQLIMDGRSQTGLVACTSIDEYLEGKIKKHELTRETKEKDRIKHVDYCDANTGPIFLTYRANEEINNIIDNYKHNNDTIFDFVAEDGVQHTGWIIEDNNIIKKLRDIFKIIPNLYIADGHHRAASAVKVGLKRREENAGYNGDEEFNYFLSVIFPDNQLKILDYNRVVKDLNGYTKEEFFEEVKKKFDVISSSNNVISPKNKATFSMYLDKKWYLLKAKEGSYNKEDPVKRLDVSILQNNLLDPILGIKDPTTDDRIDFVGGIRGLNELVRRVEDDMEVAFALVPTSIEELISIADAKKLMPPKSTWFEPKLRSGLFIHLLK